MNKEILQAALGLLKAHPEVKEIFATDDGNLFFVRAHAEDHNRGLKGTIQIITRDQKTAKDEGKKPDNTEIKDTGKKEDQSPAPSPSATRYGKDPAKMKPTKKNIKS